MFFCKFTLYFILHDNETLIQKLLIIYIIVTFIIYSMHYLIFR